VLGFLEDPLLALGLGAALADVAHEADEQEVAELVGRRHRQLDRKFLADPVDRGDLDPPAEHRPFAGLDEMGETALMRFAKGRRNDQRREVLPVRLVRAPSEQGGGTVVPAEHEAIEAHDDDSVQRRVEHGLQSGVK
jgi:hypothetical protein